MNEQEQHRLFGELLTAHQSRLYGFLFALVGNREDADDLFQSTSLTLWQRFHTFQPGSNFYAWARTTAHLLTRNFLKHKRFHTVCFNEEVLNDLAETRDEMEDEIDELYLLTLRECMTKLSVADREMMDLAYLEGLVARQLADRMGRSRQSVCNSLSRIRRQLLECIQKQLSRREHP